MLLFQYLDQLPHIPAHLTENPRIDDMSQIGFTDGGYTRWAAKDNIIDWLKTNISDNVKLAGVQTLSGEVDPHCDKRPWALNYLLDTGGDDVATEFYIVPGSGLIQPPAARSFEYTEMQKIHSVVIQPNRWHLINTHVLHGVAGITGTRTAVTVGIITHNPFDAIKDYRGLLSNT